MARTLVAALPPLVACALAWQRIEEPGWSPLLTAAAVGSVLPALAPRAWARITGSLALLVLLVAVTAEAAPWSAVGTVVDGARSASSVASPYDPVAHPSLHVAVVLVVALLGCGVSLAVAARRPLLAGGLAVVSIAWPVTLSGSDPLAWGVIALSAALWPALVLRNASVRGLAAGGVAAAAVVVAAATVAQAFAMPDEPRVDWRGWNPLATGGSRVSVRYVWEGDYSGITFPSSPTVVFRVRSPERAVYWRASTLDTFIDDRWIENLYPLVIGAPRRALPADALLPQAAAEPSGWLEQEVTIAALDERRVVAAAQPMQIAADSFERAFFLSGGVVAAEDGLTRGDTYAVWSYAPRPTPAELAESPARYPPDVARYLELGRTRMPSFGTRGRASDVEQIMASDRYPDLGPYRDVWRQARRLTAGATSPYVATLAVERWLRTTGGFVYDERPGAPPSGVPPLAHFATTGRAGYCQHFAGTMALMLRLLGVPSRVAVGFSSGSRSEGEWVVTDHDAHAWVEVWLAGHGWMAFDPTPGRGTLSLSYTLASDSADAVRALGTGRFLDFAPESRDGDAAPVPAATATDGSSFPLWPVPVAFALPFVVVVSIVLAKALRRRRRLASDDPRLVACGVRLELAAVLRDHGARVPQQATIAQLGSVATRTLGVVADQLVTAAEVARFGPPAEAARAAPHARRELQAYRAAVRRRMGVRRWAVGQVGLRSLRRA